MGVTATVKLEDRVNSRGTRGDACYGTGAAITHEAPGMKSSILNLTP